MVDVTYSRLQLWYKVFPHERHSIIIRLCVWVVIFVCVFIYLLFFTWDVLWCGLASFHPETPSGTCWKHCCLQCLNVWALQTSLHHTAFKPPVNSPQTLWLKWLFPNMYTKQREHAHLCWILTEASCYVSNYIVKELRLWIASVNLLWAHRCEICQCGDKLKRTHTKQPHTWKIWEDLIVYKIILMK